MSFQTSTPQVWFIAGCARGLGFELAKASLVASSHQPSKNPEAVDEIECLGGSWVELDVASPQLGDQAKAAFAVDGRIDVLVNHAVIGMAGAIEDFRSV